MRLIKLELNNIKSYKQETIIFSDGINCILGLNGSGKSTIIESIGSVLFNYNQRTTNNLLRYKEFKGFIALTFSGDDNNIYQIVKTIRNTGNGNVKIINYESNDVLYEGTSNVYQFVKTILRVPKEKSLAKLFEEIIAVPQGTFVNAFLETPRNRKENFDKLFELDIYKKLADNVKELSDKLKKDYIYVKEKEKAELVGKLTNYESLINEQRIVEEKIKDANKKLETINILYNKKEEEKKELDSRKVIIENLHKKSIELAAKKETLKEKIKLNNENLIKSKEAKKIIQESEYGYNLYMQKNADLQKNESVYNKYIEYKDKYKDNELTIKQLEAKNKALNEMIHNLKVTLGVNKQLIIDKNKDIEEKNKEINEYQKQINPLKKQIMDKNNEITNMQANYRYYLDKLNNINQYLLSHDKQNKINNNDKELEEILEKLNLIDANKLKIVELEKEKIKISSDLESLRINSKYMSDGCCPILKQQCLNIRGSSLNNEIMKLIEEQEKNLADINVKINELNGENQIEEQLKKDKEYLLVQKSQYNLEHDRYLAILDELKQTFKEDAIDINEENDQVIVSELIKKYQNLQEQSTDEEFDRLKALEMQISNTIFSNQNQIQINKKLLNEVEEKNKSIEKEIMEKNIELEKNSLQIIKEVNENEKIDEFLSLHNNIKSIIDDDKLIINKNIGKYEMYITNLSEASNYQKYEELNAVLIQDDKINDEQYEAIKEQINVENKTFSSEILENLNKEITDLSNEITSLNTMVNISQERFKALMEEINVLNKIIIEKNNIELLLVKYQKLDEKYQVIRDIFNNLPRELSEQIRKYIGMYSSILYRKISNDNVRVELLDDYEVVLIDCSDEKKVKTLAQLSGGEQMSVAISIRLAMLKQITNINIYFMDEPTINLDYERRMMVAEVVKDISNELEQLFVISHDDTFENITDNTIKICKIDNQSQLDE